MDNYARTIEAVLRAETDTMTIGDALNEEVKGDIDSAKTYEDVANEIKDKTGVEYSTGYLRILRRTAREFPKDVRETYLKQGIYPSVLTVVATGDVSKRKEILDDILLAIDDLTFTEEGFVESLPEQISVKMTYPEVFTKRTLELLWSSRKSAWVPTKSAVLEAFGVKNDRSDKPTTKESVLDSIEADDALRNSVIAQIASAPTFSDLLATPEGEQLAKAVFDAAEASKEKVKLIVFEDDEGEEVENTPSTFTKSVKPKKEVDYLAVFTDCLVNAKKECLKAADVFPKAEDSIDSEILEFLIESIDDAKDALVGLRDMITGTDNLEAELQTLKGTTT